MAGRPSTVTAEARTEFLQHLADGNYRCTAAKVAGFSLSALSRFLRSDDPEADTFRQAILKAENLAEAKIVSVIYQLAADDDLDAAKWYLTHKFPDRWGAQRDVAKRLEDTLKDVEALRERLRAAVDQAGPAGAGSAPAPAPRGAV